MHLQVDGDIIVFTAAFGAEHMEYDVVARDREFDEQITTACRYKKDAKSLLARYVTSGMPEEDLEIVSRKVLEPLNHALHNVDTIMTTIMEQLDVKDRRRVTSWLSGPSDENFRKEIATIRPYKGNRKDTWRPTFEHEIRGYLISRWNGQVTERQEADDAMGIQQSGAAFGESCIVTIDKDLDMIPGLHYNFRRKEKYVVTSEVAQWVFWKQMLTGDSTDNIVGCPNVGAVKAGEALDDIWSDAAAMQAAVWTLYVQAYGMAAWPAFIENGRLLWIRREEEQLWSPTI